LHDRCHACAFRGPACLCGELSRVHNHLPVVVLRHAAELSKPTGSARWASLALSRCEIVDYALLPEPFDDRVLDSRGAWLVFPGAATSVPPGKPARLIVPDGTWQQARRMVARVAKLRSLPRLSLPPPLQTARLRRAPRGGMSTLEAISAALGACGDPAAAAALHAVHERVMARAVAARGPPSARETSGGRGLP
jgi:DTW domain-containing protein YfiP